AQDYRSLSLNAGNVATTVGGSGRVWLVEWIEAQFVPKDRVLEGVFVGTDSALAVVSVPEANTAVGVQLTMSDSLIAAYSDLRWRDAHLDGGLPDARLNWVDDLVDRHVAAWPGEPGPGANIESFPGDDGGWSGGEVITLGPGERSGRAVFVSPDLAVYLLAASTGDGCEGKYAVILTLDSGDIVWERRMPSLETVRACLMESAPEDGWWNDIEVPPPVSEQVTGVIAERDGTEITVFNGSPELERLLVWGLERFEMAGLVRPQVLTASFAPLPVCAGVSGTVNDTIESGSDLVLCTDAHRACLPDREACTEFRVGDRLGMLHELSHIWLLDNLDADTEAAFLESRGLDVWISGSVAWHERGAEQAAEILAWGLMDEAMPLVRIGDPECEEVAEAYSVLTGSPVRQSCP
ncbi:MAG: hypothetical protein GY722_00550, partial [bacterium]|nr:hypothetical protein [bacterium]